MKLTISTNQIKGLKKGSLDHFPKYTTYLINQASQTAQATRPSVVGQLSNEYPNYAKECEVNGVTPTLEGWREYHTSKFPDALSKSTLRINEMISNFKAAIDQIDEALVLEWVKDLLYEKTFYGFNVEATIKLYLVDRGVTVVDSTPEDESKNIDLYINDRPYQIKPKSLGHRQSVASYIAIPIIIYEETDKGIIIEFEDDYLKGLLKDVI